MCVCVCVCEQVGGNQIEFIKVYVLFPSQTSFSENLLSTIRVSHTFDPHAKASVRVVAIDCHADDRAGSHFRVLGKRSAVLVAEG